MSYWNFIGASAGATGKGYHMFGNSGGTKLQDTDEYDSAIDVWTSKTSGPSPARERLAPVNLLSAIYCTFGKSSVRLVDNDKYVVDTWTSMTNATGNRESPGAAAPGNGKLYAYTGLA